MEAQLVFNSALRESEALTARQWASLLGVTGKAFQLRRIPVTGKIQVQGGAANIFRFVDLPVDWRERLEIERLENRCLNFRDLLDVVAVETRVKIDLRDISGGRFTSISEFPPDAQSLAHLRMKSLHVYYDALERGLLEKNANALAQQLWRDEARHMILSDGRPLSQSMRDCTYKKIQRLRKKIDKLGGPLAPIEAYLDGKACAHPNQRKELPKALVKDFHARMTDSRFGVPSAAAIHREYSAAWEAGSELPGVGARIGDEPFPITVAQLQRVSPARAVREIAGRGKFAAKTKKLLAAPPLDWSNVEPMRVVMFDDKVLDCQVLTDDGLRTFRPVIYLAYCAGTGRVLAFIAREEGRMTQLDVEGLEAAVLRDHGFHEPSIWVRELGTVSMSKGRKEFLERHFHRHLLIHNTMMIGGANALGDWKQAGKGNFFGKGRLEAFMWTLDNLAHTIPGQTGNEYQQQPATLGDTTLSLQTIINSAKQRKIVQANDGSLVRVPRNRPSGSLLEESILTAAMSRVIAFLENGENLTAIEAAMKTGIRPPLMYYSDFVAMLCELFRRHNNRRGHAMQGFERVRVPHPNNGGSMLVSESPNDKASRMLAQMELRGRKIRRPSDKDIALLLHKVTRVVVKNNGAVVNGVRYWHNESQAQKDALSIAGGQKVFLALYNPVAPDALYLLANPPGHLNASAVELPHNFKPQLYEVLPRWIGPDPTDRAAMRERSSKVARFNEQFTRAVAVYSEPRLLAQSEKRQEIHDRLEPMRSTIRSAEPSIEAEVIQESALSNSIQAAENVITRRDKQIIAQNPLEKFLSQHISDESGGDDDEPQVF